jgi:hypothetical protein
VGTRPAAVLPKEVGDIVLPFRIGINNDFKAFLKPEIHAKMLRLAIKDM